MYFGMKNYLKSTRNHTAKHALSHLPSIIPIIICFRVHSVMDSILHHQTFKLNNTLIIRCEVRLLIIDLGKENAAHTICYMSKDHTNLIGFLLP